MLIQLLSGTNWKDVSVLKSLWSEYTKWVKRKKMKYQGRGKNAMIYQYCIDVKAGFFFLSF